MVEKVRSFIKKSRLALTGAIIAVTVGSAGAFSFVQPQAAQAASCDKVNIVYCGLNGNALTGYIKSFKSFYNSGKSNGHSDLKAVYRWAGATNASVSKMGTGNSKMGTLYRNGDIKVNGQVVATDSWVSARFGAGRPGFVHVEGDVYARKTTTSLAHDTYPMLVHFNSNGQMDFAVMVDCGNAVKGHPKKPQPKPVLNCIALTAHPVTGTPRKYAFTAKAEAKHTTVTRYTFDFGDGSSKTVKTNKQKVSLNHKYAKADQKFKASVAVSSKDVKNVSSPKCRVTVKTPSPKPVLTCVDLTKQFVNGHELTYKFTATAHAENTQIVSYTFNFGDGTTKTVKTSEEMTQVVHQFAKHDTKYTITVVVNGKKGSDKCKVTLKTPKVHECKPGIPVGDSRCHVCQPQVETCKPTKPITPPKKLVTTGMGAGSIIGLFGATVSAAAFGHRYFIRRKYGF
jgi:hypothetical protein